MTTTQDHRTPRIVVGVDGSPSSKAALRWAVRQAERTGAVVEAVTAWWYPTGYGMAPTSDWAVDLERTAEKTLVEALAEVSGVAPDVVVSPRVAEGHPADVLLRAARGADLLVVGSRGHGGFAAALLGSVSQHCTQHAPCPVLVIRGNYTELRRSVCRPGSGSQRPGYAVVQARVGCGDFQQPVVFGDTAQRVNHPMPAYRHGCHHLSSGQVIAATAST